MVRTNTSSWWGYDTHFMCPKCHHEGAPSECRCENCGGPYVYEWDDLGGKIHCARCHNPLYPKCPADCGAKFGPKCFYDGQWGCGQWLMCASLALVGWYLYSNWESLPKTLPELQNWGNERLEQLDEFRRRAF